MLKTRKKKISEWGMENKLHCLTALVQKRVARMFFKHVPYVCAVKEKVFFASYELKLQKNIM